MPFKMTLIINRLCGLRCTTRLTVILRIYLYIVRGFDNILAVSISIGLVQYLKHLKLLFRIFG